MAPILLCEPPRTPFRFLLNNVHQDTNSDHQTTPSALTNVYYFPKTNTTTATNKEPNHANEPNSTTTSPTPTDHLPPLPTTPILTHSMNDPESDPEPEPTRDTNTPLHTLLRTLQSTNLTSTTSPKTTTTAISTLSTTPRDTNTTTNALLLQIYSTLLHRIETYTNNLVWEHEILLSNGNILLSRSARGYRMDIEELEVEYQEHYEMCEGLVNELGGLVEREGLENPGWVMVDEGWGWEEVREGVRRVRATLEEVRWRGKYERRGEWYVVF